MKKTFLIFCSLVLGYAQGFSQSLTLNDGLVGHFPLETNGYDDVTSTTYTATGITTVSGGINGSTAVSFNDVNSYIDAGNSSRDISSEVSVSVWVKTTSSDVADCIASKYYHVEDKGFGLFISGGKAKFDGRNGNNTYFTSGVSTTLVNDGQWHHLVGIANKNSFQIWVDGIKESEYIFSFCTQDYNAISKSLVIGKNSVHPGNGDFFFYEGALNDLSIYNRTLTPCEIKSLASTYNAALSLVGHFPLNGDTEDYSSTNVDGSGINITSVAGRTSGTQAASFNNTNSYISAGNSSRNITSEVSVSAWVKTTSSDVANTVLSKYNHIEEKGYGMFISNGKAKFDGRNGNNTYFSSGASITSVNDGEWHHLIGIANETSFQIWVDGVKESELTFTGNTPDYNATTMDLLIGKNCVHPGNGDFFFYEGAISDVKIYNRTLSECEIETLTDDVAIDNSLVAHFNLDGNTNDISTQHEDGIPINISMTPFALYFNDEDSYIDAGNSSRQITTEITASAWVKTSSSDVADCILSKYNHIEDKGFGLFISGGKAKFDGRNGNNTYYSSGASSTSVDDGLWHFITGIANATSFQVYVDGVKESEFTFTGNTPDYNATSKNLLIGRNCVHPGNGDYFFFNGAMSQVKLFNRALSPCEVNDLYTQSIITGVKDETSAETASAIATISPNPFEHQFALTFKQPSNFSYSITLSDCNGKILSQHASNGSTPVQLGEEFASGLYIGKVEAEGKTYFFKVVKR